MADFEIEITGIKELAQKLSVDEFKKTIQAALMGGAMTVTSIVSRYPPIRTRKQPFKTDKSRRWFFANLRAGNIRVPYVRTANLGRKWTQRAIRWNEVEVGNNTPYAPLVQDRNKQSGYHEGNWRTTDDIAEQDNMAVVNQVARGIENYLRNI